MQKAFLKFCYLRCSLGSLSDKHRTNSVVSFLTAMYTLKIEIKYFRFKESEANDQLLFLCTKLDLRTDYTYVQNCTWPNPRIKFVIVCYCSGCNKICC